MTKRKSKRGLPKLSRQALRMAEYERKVAAAKVKAWEEWK